MKSRTKSPGGGGSSEKLLEAVKTPDMLRLLVESVRDYAIILLDTKGNILTWSPTAERLKGWKADEVIGKHFSVFYPADAQDRPAHELTVAEQEGRFEDENWRMRKDGSRFWANVTITALRDEAGKLWGFGKVTRDLTSQRLAEEKIKKQAQELFEMAAVPVVQVWEGVLLVPLIGTLDSQRTQHLMERLLQRVTETVAAVRLLGADVVLTGVRPTIAQTLVHLGIDLSNVITRSSLTAGLRMALDIMNLKVGPKA